MSSYQRFKAVLHSPRASSWKTAATLSVAAIAASACGKGVKSVPGVAGFHAGVVNGRLIVSFTATTFTWDGGLQIPIPGLRDATLSATPAFDGSGTIFQFTIRLGALLGGSPSTPVSGLPDGRPLPDVVSGALPRWDVPVRDLVLSLYLSDDAFAVFIPLKLVDRAGKWLPSVVSALIEDERGNRLGKVYAIPRHVSGSGGGLFILLPYLGGTSAVNTKTGTQLQ